MSQKLIWVGLMALLAFASPSWASENLPTSENPALGEWTRMQHASFDPTFKSAREQCDRVAKLDQTDRLTPAKCERFEQLLEARQCVVRVVGDVVVFDHMNGRASGQSVVTHRVKKKLGREDTALLCDLGDQVYTYWFVGDKNRSCNNVGVVFSAKPEEVKTVTLNPTPEPQKPSGRVFVPAENAATTSPSQQFYEPGVARQVVVDQLYTVIDRCITIYTPGVVANVPGSPIRAIRH